MFNDPLGEQPARKTLKTSQSEKVIVDPEWASKIHKRNDINMKSGYHLVTFNVEGVNEELRVKDLEKEMLNSGHLIYETQFKKNPITNKRAGTGVMHARAKTREEVDAITEKLTAQGMKVAVSQKYQPTWKN